MLEGIENDERSFEPDPHLNEKQNAALLEVLTWLHCQASSETGSALRVLIHGGPGTGKSFFANILIEKARTITQGGKIQCCAPTGIAATLLPGGQTVHSLLKLPIDKRRRKKSAVASVQDAKNRLAGVHLLIIDEISMVNASLLE